MTITAKNYASAAASSIAKWLPNLDKNDFKRDIISVKNMLLDLQESVHFVMPDSGVLLDDDLAGIRNTCVRLPYPSISVEYYMPKGGPEILDKRFPLTDVNKRVILAKEYSLEMLRSFPKHPIPDALLLHLGESDHVIVISTIFRSEDIGIWSPCPIAIAIPSKWDAGRGRVPTFGKDYGRPSFMAVPIPFLPDMVSNIPRYKETNETEIFEGAMQDISPEVIVLLELLEALSCSNVEESTYQEASKKNAQRIKSHKNPIWETKFLTLVVNPKSGKKGESSGITHASPRQHLRRGHIRRLPSKNIWVTSCVVGDASNGKIEKQYKIQK